MQTTERFFFPLVTIAVVLAGAMLSLYPNWPTNKQSRRSVLTKNRPDLYRHLPTATDLSHYARSHSALLQASTELGDTDSLEHYLVSGPTPMATWNNIGIERSIHDFKVILDDAPADDLTWSNLAWLYASIGNTQNAIKAERRAIDLYPFDYTYHLLLGSFYERNGDISDAEKSFEQAVALYPRLEQSEFWTDLVEQNPRIASSVAQHLQLRWAGLTSNSDPQEMERAARFLWNNDIKREAVLFAGRTKKVLPSLSGTWELIGEADEQGHQIEAAALDYRRAEYLDSLDPLPHERLAQVALSAENPRSSKDELQLAWTSSAAAVTPASSRCALLFKHSVRTNEQLPRDLEKQTSPAFDFSTAYKGLAELYYDQGEAEEAAFMRKRAEWIATQGHIEEEYGDH